MTHTRTRSMGGTTYWDKDENVYMVCPDDVAPPDDRPLVDILSDQEKYLLQYALRIAANEAGDPQSEADFLSLDHRLAGYEIILKRKDT